MFRDWKEAWLHDQEDLTLAQLAQLENFLQLFSAAWLLNEREGQTLQAISALETFTIETSNLSVIRVIPTVLPPFAVHVAAHLFSGRRRDGDIQMVLEQKGFKTISIDMIFDPIFGNLLRASTFSFFKMALQRGWVHAIIAGPPGETWSKVRKVATRWLSSKSGKKRS